MRRTRFFPGRQIKYSLYIIKYKSKVIPNTAWLYINDEKYRRKPRDSYCALTSPEVNEFYPFYRQEFPWIPPPHTPRPPPFCLSAHTPCVHEEEGSLWRGAGLVCRLLVREQGTRLQELTTATHSVGSERAPGTRDVFILQNVLVERQWTETQTGVSQLYFLL